MNKIYVLFQIRKPDKKINYERYGFVFVEQELVCSYFNNNKN